MGKSLYNSLAGEPKIAGAEDQSEAGRTLMSEVLQNRNVSGWEKLNRRINILLRDWSPQIFLAELLSKRWMEAVFPFLLMIGLFIFFGLHINNYFTVYNIAETSREFAEFGFVALAMAFVIISGGIDLSVGSIFAIANFVALLLFHLFGWPILMVIPAVLIAGALMGACNGFLIGYMRTRAFLTTLVTLIVFRACVGLLSFRYSADIVANMNESQIFDFLGEGNIMGVPTNIVFLVFLAGFGHLFLTRTRPGWHLNAIGGARRSARHAGIAVKRTVFLTYVASGVLTSMGAVFYASRLASMNADTGRNWEMLALTAVVMGGVSLSGGKGSIMRAMIGATIVMVLTNGLLRMGIGGSFTPALLGFILIIAVAFDTKWVKNRYKVIKKIYVVPGYNELPNMIDVRSGKENVFTINDRLNNAEPIGLNQVEGPEDIILDRQGRLYGSCRQGKIIRFSGENFEKREVFCQMGGRPLGMAFDRDDNLILCNGGMGLYGIRPDGEVYKLTDETNRTWWKLNDDSRLCLTDDLDIAPDGKIYFSEATERYEMHSWVVDALESRGNGRIVCYDPATDQTRTIIRNLLFPNGICTSHDGQSILFAETWGCTVKRYWIQGPKKGQTEVVLDNLPGAPDNINRASNDNYWLAIVGLMTPSFHLALRYPKFRTQMVKRVPPTEWLLPNINRGCVIKFNSKGEILDVLWDSTGIRHPVITSMREDRGYLYLGGLFNNRIGRIKLDDADPDWFGPDTYWRNKN